MGHRARWIALLLSLFSSLCLVTPASAQDAPEVYSATLIASEGMAGSVSGRMVIKIVAHSTDAEKASLTDAFKKSQESGIALLHTMSKGFINVEGQPGRKIYAVFLRNRDEGHELITISDHVLSKLEKWNGVKAEDHPLAVVHLRFDSSGALKSGEVFPAVKVTVTPDGFVDVQTDNSNKIMMMDLKKQ